MGEEQFSHALARAPQRGADLGQTLAEAMSVLDQWVVDHYYEIAGARERYLRGHRGKNSGKAT